jgi:hypothetical protein
MLDIHDGMHSKTRTFSYTDLIKGRDEYFAVPTSAGPFQSVSVLYRYRWRGKTGRNTVFKRLDKN